MDDYAAFDRLARTVYLAARAGAVDCTAAFDLAAAKLEVSPLDPDTTELALLSLECAEASQPRMAEVALRLLATAWDPGFTEEPGWLASLEDAMRLVNRDVTATGIRHPCQLRVRDDQAGGSFDVYAGLPLAVALSAQGKRVHLANLSFANLGALALADWVGQDAAGVPRRR